MQESTLRCFAILLAPGLLGCEADDAPTPHVAASSPVIHVAEPRVELGELALSSEKFETRFRIANLGFSVLHIEGLHESCRCTSAQVSRTSIAPNADAELIVNITPSEAGAQRASVIVYSNDPEHPAMDVGLTWNAVAPLEIEPSSMDIGNLQARQQREFVLRAVWRSVEGQNAVIIDHVDALRPELRIEPAGDPSTQSLQPLSAWKVTLNAGDAYGDNVGAIRFHLRDAWCEVLDVPVRWRVAPAVGALPDRLFLGAVHSREVIERRILVQALENAGALEVREVAFETPISGATVECTVLSSHVVALDVKWIVPDEAGAHAGEIKVTTACPEALVINVPLSGIVLDGEKP